MPKPRTTLYTSRWVYQISGLPIEKYRKEVTEGAELVWPRNKRMFSKDLPTPGDLMYCLYSESSRVPGICGWGFILKYFPKTQRIRWRALPPTNRLKKEPWWDDTLQSMLPEILGVGAQRRGTMFPVPATLDTMMRRGLFAWQDARR
jgi:hypothetical protein